jgi:hypothetical protein
MPGARYIYSIIVSEFNTDSQVTSMNSGEGKLIRRVLDSVKGANLDWWWESRVPHPLYGKSCMHVHVHVHEVSVEDLMFCYYTCTFIEQSLLFCAELVMVLLTNKLFMTTYIL